MLAILLTLATARIQPSEVNAWPVSDRVVFVECIHGRITDVGADGFSAWTGYWSQRQADGSWSISILDDAPDVVLTVTVEDPIHLRRVYRVDRYGFEVAK